MESEEVNDILDQLDVKELFATVNRREYSEKLFHASGGPKNLGDPSDKTLSTYEKEVLLPYRLISTIQTFFCKDICKAYDECCFQNKWTFPVTCSSLLGESQDCLKKHFNAPLYQSLAEEYLLERSHYRESGIRTRRFNRGMFVSRPEQDGSALDHQGQYVPRKPDCWKETYQDSTPKWAQ